MKSAVKPLYLDEIKTSADKIRDRMLAEVANIYDKSEGSYVYDALAPISIELTKAADLAQQLLPLTFAQATFGQYLDLRAEEHGLVRRPATLSAGRLTIEGDVGTFIPQGTCFATAANESMGLGSVIFKTKAAHDLIVSPMDIDVIAVKPGTIGNIASNTLTIIMGYVKGVKNVYNKNTMSGGADIENDDSLRERLLFAVRNPATSGNVNNYKKWATSIEGVGKCNVMPLWAGRGTVKLVLVDMQNKPVNNAIKRLVEDYVIGVDGTGSGQAPIGATVTVVPAKESPIEVGVQVNLKAPYTDIKDAKDQIEKTITEYLEKLVFAEDPCVRHSHIGSRIQNCPAVNYYKFLLLNRVENFDIDIDKESLAVLGQLIVSKI